MAEAHQAVAVQFTISHEGKIDFNVNHEMIKEIYHSGRRTWIKKLLRLQNRMKRHTYPASPASWLAVLTAVVVCVYARMDPSMGMIDTVRDHFLPTQYFDKPTNTYLSSIIFATLLWFVMIVFLRYTLKLMLYYKGYMYDQRGKPSLATKIWMILMKVFCIRQPGTYSYQGSLPNLPVPSLKDTMERHLRSVKAVFTEDKYKRMEQLAKEFEEGIGPKLQRYVCMKWMFSTNYVTDWWEEYVYLRGRSPIMVNSNYYGMDSIAIQASNIQTARAANLVCTSILFRRMLERETLKPLLGQGAIPLCSWQYERLFNTTRIPGMESDKLVHLEDSRHIAVMHRGRMYKLQFQVKGYTLQPAELESQFQAILDDEYEPTEAELHLPALTAGERTPWASARKRFFSSGVNKTSLDIVETAAFVLVLDEEEHDYDERDLTEILASQPRPSWYLEQKTKKNFNLDEYGKALIHGKCYDRWFDKSFTLVVFKNGRLGVNAEHSFADAPVVAHLFEWAMCEDKINVGYREDGHCMGEPTKDFPKPKRLKWEIPDELHNIINNSLSVARKLADDVDLHIMVHNAFGKGAMKKCKISPDAFIQNAMQLAYYREANGFALTYESSMTRLYREGRTETVRPCTIECTNFVKAMEDPSVSNEEKKRLFMIATDTHVKSYRDAMCGKGVDRHLFTLYVVSRYLNLDSPFLKEVLGEPWRLSTSQTPATQTNRLDVKKHPYYTSAGGGFGPVADDGYGVSYIIAGEDNIFFHISSKRSCPTTDSHKFAYSIRMALGDVLALYQ